MLFGTIKETELLYSNWHKPEDVLQSTTKDLFGPFHPVPLDIFPAHWGYRNLTEWPLLFFFAPSPFLGNCFCVITETIDVSQQQGTMSFSYTSQTEVNGWNISSY